MNQRAWLGLIKLGDTLIGTPKTDEQLPPFATVVNESRTKKDLEEVFEQIEGDERRQLEQLLTICGYLPRFILSFFWVAVSVASRWSGPAGTTARQLKLGLRGLLVSLYFSTPETNVVLGFQPKVLSPESHSLNPHSVDQKKQWLYPR